MAKATTAIGELTQGGRGGKRRTPVRVGRQTKLTPELSKKICDVVRAGNYVSVAARYCGVSEYTVHEWIARGRGESSRLPSARIYEQFVKDLDAAEAGSEVTAVLHWRAAQPKDWHAAERWLRTRLPERWGDKEDANARTAAFAGVQVNISGANGQLGAGMAQNGLNAPIASLLEDNPHLIGGVMQILDQLLPIEGETPQIGSGMAESVLSDAESPANGTEVHQNSSMAHLDAEEAVWMANDDEEV